MNITYLNTIIFVKDITISKQFYTEILGLNVINDYETIVFFENHLVLHLASSIIKTIFRKISKSSRMVQGRKNILIYFETHELVKTFNKIKRNKVKIIHEIEKQAWGQKVFRIYDPDGHIIEIGEPFRMK